MRTTTDKKYHLCIFQVHTVGIFAEYQKLSDPISNNGIWPALFMPLLFNMHYMHMMQVGKQLLNPCIKDKTDWYYAKRALSQLGCCSNFLNI